MTNFEFSANDSFPIFLSHLAASFLQAGKRQQFAWRMIKRLWFPAVLVLDAAIAHQVRVDCLVSFWPLFIFLCGPRNREESLVSGKRSWMVRHRSGTLLGRTFPWKREGLTGLQSCMQTEIKMESTLSISTSGESHSPKMIAPPLPFFFCSCSLVPVSK